ncbi:hypothetical protein BRW65_07990 [Mycobacterium paraffinicum]|uniref:Acyl-CoA dehydrogenase C-terminal domain-containing protein n=1 Tax=Mycobacterium paraffinicum TaxID=53378 RepID=A0A1Q4HY70_9MYCO|nr:acyl-CoA dehydrogenase family protein [Mycobacterium paraffinicum]OJZ74647.1 hypothetical protein BRW65_07990 [Mycobacterium paraffinicum]
MTDTLATQHRHINEQIVARAHALRSVLEENVATGEELRRSPDVVNDALERNGMFRLFTPTCFGGYAVGVTTAIEVVAALAEGDASASWMIGIAAVGSWIAAQSSPQLQDEIFASNPDARLAGSLTPVPAQRVKGGWRVTGSWTFASGAHHAEWALLSLSVVGGRGADEEILLCFVPAREVTLQRSWYTVGMRATGSDSWVAEDVFVPDYRTMSVRQLIMGTQTTRHDEPIFRVPLAPAAPLFGLGTLLGTGKAALDFVAARARTKPLHNTCFARQSDSAGVRIQVGEAAVKIATARLHAYDIANALDEAAADNRPISYADRAAWKARCGYAAQQIVEALNMLLNVHGASSFAESNRLQQYWRDANTLARHSTMQMVVGYEVFGESLLGVDKRITTHV